MQQTKKISSFIIGLLLLSSLSIIGIPQVKAADTITLGIKAQSLPDNTLRVYTWDGADYIEVASQVWEPEPTIHEFDLSTYLPDIDNQYKVMIKFENGDSSESSIDWVYMTLNDEPLVVNTAEGILGDIRDTVIEDDGVSYYSTNYDAWIEFVAWSAPVANAGGPYTGYEGQLIKLDASLSTGLVNDLIYRWDFQADGTWDYESMEPTIIYLLPDAGNVNVLLEVDDGVMTGQTTTTINVKDMTPSTLVTSIDGALSTSTKSGKILILGDGYSEGDVTDGPIIGTAQVLREAGFTVDIASVKSDAWDGTNPSPEDYSLIILLVGANTKSPASGEVELGDMPAAGQTALMRYVMNGGGLLFGEWVSLQVRDYGYYTGFQDLIMFDWDLWDEYNSADTYNVILDHPITDDLPASFDVSYHWYSCGVARPGSTVIVQGSTPHTYDAVVVKDFNAGKVVEFSWANNWAEYDEGLSPWDAVMKTLYTNAATWASAQNGVSELTAVQGTPLTFNIESSDTGLNQDLTYTIQWGDDETSTLTIPHTGDRIRTASLTHTYIYSGEYEAKITATDSLGASSYTRNVLVTIEREPIIADAGPDQTTTEGIIVTFDASGTQYGVGSIVTYFWDFGDGATASGVDLINPTHIYADNGIYTVTLTTIDDLEQTSTDTMTVTVDNFAPSVSAGSDASGQPGDILTFTGQAIDTGMHDILTYAWDFGDGSPIQTGVDLTTVTHAYEAEGVYTVTLTVTDNDGGIGFDTATATITTIVNSPPVANAGPDVTAKKGVTITFDGSGTYDPNEGDVLTYVWDFGDGTIVTGVDLVAPTHAYAAAGVYTVTLTVTDDQGASSTDTATATITSLTTPHEYKIEARTLLLSSKTGIASNDCTIDAIVYLIDQSLTPKYWVDDSHLSDKWGIKVFIYEGLASHLLETNIAQYEKQIDNMEKLIALYTKLHKDTTALQAQVDAMRALLPVFEQADAMLAKADEGLAKTALDEASAMTPSSNHKNSFNNLIKKAKEAYNEGVKYEAKGEYTKAIFHFKLSWIYSRQAVHVLQGEPNWNCGNGNYYDVNWTNYNWKYDWDYTWNCDWKNTYNNVWKNKWNYSWYSNNYDNCKNWGNNWNSGNNWGCGNNGSCGNNGNSWWK
jgi:PKD repeat protein